MVVLSFGMTKSGSTLAFELCKSVLETAGFPQRRLPDGVVVAGRRINFIEPVTVESLKRAVAEVADGEMVAIKAHDAVRRPEMQFIEDAIAAGKMKLHVNYRDPREMALSLVDAGAMARSTGRQSFSEFTRIEETIPEIGKQLDSCRSWGSISGALLLFYNDVGFDTRAVVNRMSANLGVGPFDDTAIDQIIAFVQRAFTQKNRAVKDRYKELTRQQSELLLDRIPSARPFVDEVCVAKNLGWFNRELRALQMIS